jgi:hypothetical protein
MHDNMLAFSRFYFPPKPEYFQQKPKGLPYVRGGFFLG